MTSSPSRQRSDIRKHLGRPSRLEDDIAAFERLGYGLVAIVDLATDRIVGYAKLQCPEWKEGLGLELVVAVAAEAYRNGHHETREPVSQFTSATSP